MRILVTGGMGEIGRPTARWLTDHGHDVRVLDLAITGPIDGAECIEGDVTDFGSLGPAMADIDGVIHLAAVRHPGLAPEHTIFHVNAVGTFNVFRAAADAGIRRVVCASSINALGYNFGIKFPEGQLRYFPIDEAHPTYTTDVYSFSKGMIEEIGAYFWRREGISSVLLRFPAVYDTTTTEPTILMAFVSECYRQTAEVMALPEPRRTQRVEAIVADFKRRAAAREWEEGFNWSFRDAVTMFGRSNFWTSLEVRDAAQAAEKGLLADLEGSHAVYVTDTHNFVDIPSRDLAEVWFPEVTEWKSPVEGTESLVSIDAARALIGFEPAYPFQGRGQ
jgi:nucleoside-diphosphate-sugar epimerase